jgi:hypothetical protein
VQTKIKLPGGASHSPVFDVRGAGAREHNLKNVDVDIRRDALVVFTGVSGSGKSSLAFGTLHAEAQRRYLESVAPSIFHALWIAKQHRRAVNLEARNMPYGIRLLFGSTMEIEDGTTQNTHRRW